MARLPHMPQLRAWCDAEPVARDTLRGHGQDRALRDSLADQTV